MPRLFFALRPESSERTRIAVAARPTLQSLGGEPVAVDDLHLTLGFLGEVPAEKLPAVLDAAATVPPPQSHLALTHIDCWTGARVLCLLPEEDAGLAAVARLASGLNAAASAAGLTPDAKPFRAHVTVGRKIPATAPRGANWPQPLEAPLFIVAGGFVLMESRRSPARPRYAVLHRWQSRRPGNC